MIGGIAGKTAPAAADVQEMILALQIDFPADEVELFLLGFRQIVSSLKVGATVLVVGVQEGKKEVVPEIVMLPGDDPRPGRRLEIEDPDGKVKEERSEVSFDFLLQISLEKTTDEFIDPQTVPPTLHVSFPKPETSLFQYAGVKPLIPHLNVPGIGTVDPDADFGKQLLDHLPVRLHIPPP
jgi:hypothetical protein